MEKIVRFVFWAAIFVALVVGFARLAFLRWWRVPEDDPWLQASIAPTLEGGDLVLLWRLTKPSFGDLVLCPEPSAPERVVIGRIAAEAGDTIKIDADGLSVNGKAAETERACGTFEVEDPTTRARVTQHCQIETLAGHAHMRGARTGQKANLAPVRLEVPEGKVFLLSDNRLYSYDSRDYGTVERASCTETVFYRLVSRKGFGHVESRLTLIR